MTNHPNRSKRRRLSNVHQPQVTRTVKVALHSATGELDRRLVVLREGDDDQGLELDIKAAAIGLIEAAGALYVGDQVRVEELKSIED